MSDSRTSRAPSPLSAKTALCGIVLHPAGHTRSPAMHNAAFTALGIDAVYLAFDVVPGRLGDAIAGARALGVRQLALWTGRDAPVDVMAEAFDRAGARSANGTQGV
ncbi:MAG: hypothetical protein OEM05_11705 [Myxococcales bacterium]|nr:hypothetical protein [Myxococcales bacterium]